MLLNRKRYQRGISWLACGALAILTATATVEAQPRKSYGLGVPSGAVTGGATRDSCRPLLALLAPQDGARTLSARPTFFWYVAPGTTQADSKDIFDVTLILRESKDNDTKRVFTTKGSLTQYGVYKFVMPTDAPSLEAGKAQRWDIRLEKRACNNSVITNNLILLENNPQVTSALTQAKTDLDKARIYATNAYWYDALAAYSSWLERNPTDSKARQEQVAMLREGLKGHPEVAEADLKLLLSKLEEIAPRPLPPQIAPTSFIP